MVQYYADRQQTALTTTSAKWIILAYTWLCSFATYHCFFSIAGLESKIISLYDIEFNIFSIFATISYIGAAIGCIATPYLIHRFGICKVVISGQFCLLMGQTITIVTITLMEKMQESHDQHQVVFNFMILLVGRLFVGIPLGSAAITAPSMIGKSFRFSRKLSLAFGILGNAIDMGIRYVI